eukprot:SAG31_NODE_3095_length_4682_cov_2.946542_5_plen_150_part_00
MRYGSLSLSTDGQFASFLSIGNLVRACKSDVLLQLHWGFGALMQLRKRSEHANIVLVAKAGDVSTNSLALLTVTERMLTVTERSPAVTTILCDAKRHSPVIAQGSIRRQHAGKPWRSQSVSVRQCINCDSKDPWVFSPRSQPKTNRATL